MEVSVVLAAHVAAGLLLVAGLAKVVRPAVASEALALTRLPAETWLVRAVGSGELVLGVSVLTFGGSASFALLAAAYTAFVVVAERQRRAGASCGCFGSSGSAVGPLHLGVDGVAALAAGSASVRAGPGLAALTPSSPIGAVTMVGLLIVAVALARLTLTALPELLAVRARLATGAWR